MREFVRNPQGGTFRASTRFAPHWFLRALTAFPRTFNQKVRYKMIRDRRPVLGLYSDKAASRDHVVALLGPQFVPTTYCVLDDPHQLATCTLPRSYAAKVTHASGGVVLVGERFDPLARLPNPEAGFTLSRVHPDAVNLDELTDLLASWQRRAYGVGKGEWSYSLVRPRILVEELLADDAGAPPLELKLYVMNGTCRMIRVLTVLPSGVAFNHYWRDGRPIDVRYAEYHGPEFDQLSPPPPLPGHVDELVDVAEHLARDTDFLRVDMFLLAGRTLVGELTNYPGNGTSRFRPASVDRDLGDFWSVPRTYDRLPNSPAAYP